MRIALDVVGGDYAPQSTIEGAKLALNELSEEVTLVLIGPEDLVNAKLEDAGVNSKQVEVCHAPEVIEMGEHPYQSAESKTTSIHTIWL